MTKFCIYAAAIAHSGYPVTYIILFIYRHSLQQILMQIRRDTGHLSWLEFSFYIYLKNCILCREGCIDDEERIWKMAFILLVGCLAALWEFIKEKSPFHPYSKHPGLAQLVRLQTPLETQLKITFPWRSHCTIYLNTRFSLFYKILLQITRSRWYSTWAWSFWLLESWLNAQFRWGLRFWGTQAHLDVVFQWTNMTLTWFLFLNAA